MAKPFSPQRKTIFPLIFGIGIGVIFLAAILVIFVGYQFSQYRSEGGDLLEKEAYQVIIVDPALGSEFPLGIPMFITARALGPEPFLSAELWVDGKLVEVQAGPSGGSIPLNAIFSWIPTTPGAHSLVARAINTETQSAYSTSVVVFITSKLDASQTAVDTEGSAGGDGVADEQASNGGDNGGGGSYVPPEPPVPGDSVTPGKPWQGSPAEWITNMMTNQAPSAPELIASAETCAASLSIHDLSDNEEGFVIYRQVSGSPAWEQVAALASSNGDWLTYTEDNVFGGLLYYAAAFNSLGESNSNLALVNIDPSNCSPQVESPQSVTLELTKLIPVSGAENSYCYRSFNGLQWARWPQDGFLNSHNEPILLSDLDGEPLFETIDLMLECWGWAGAELQYLGNAVFNDLDPREPGLQRSDSENISVEVLIRGADVFQKPVFPMGADDDFSGLLPHITPLAYIKLPMLSLEMPEVFPFITYDPDECMNHLPPKVKNLFGKIIFCFPYDGFDSGLEGANPQPYLAWNIGQGCLAGVGSPPCKTYADWLAQAEAEGGTVGFDIHDSSSGGNKTWFETAPHKTSYVIPPVSCNGPRSFRVLMWYKPPNSGQIITGPLSNPVTLTCPHPLSSTLVDITFSYVVFLNVDDDDSDEQDQDIEVYGFFYADTTASEGDRYLVRGRWVSFDGCRDDDLAPGGSLNTSGGLGSNCFTEMENEPLLLHQNGLCQAWNNDDLQDAKYGVCNRPPGWAINNNTLRLFVGDHEDIYLYAALFDHDWSSSDDVACIGGIYTDAKPATEWAKTHNEILTITTPDNGNASCVISIEINAVPPSGNE